MNLDKTFCSPKNCVNDKCDRRLGLSIVKAAEKLGGVVWVGDFSEDCKERIKKGSR